MGDLKGITQKLDYLEELGVSCIYLNYRRSLLKSPLRYRRLLAR